MFDSLKELIALREADSSDDDLSSLDLDTLDDDGDDDATKAKPAKSKKPADDSKDGEKPETVVLTKDALEVLIAAQADGENIDVEELLDSVMDLGYLDADQVKDLLDAGSDKDDSDDSDKSSKASKPAKKTDDSDEE